MGSHSLGFKGSEVQRFRGSGFRGSEVQRFRVQRFRVQRLKEVYTTDLTPNL